MRGSDRIEGASQCRFDEGIERRGTRIGSEQGKQGSWRDEIPDLYGEVFDGSGDSGSWFPYGCTGPGNIDTEFSCRKRFIERSALSLESFQLDIRFGIACGAVLARLSLFKCQDFTIEFGHIESEALIPFRESRFESGAIRPVVGTQAEERRICTDTAARMDGDTFHGSGSQGDDGLECLFLDEGRCRRGHGIGTDDEARDRLRFSFGRIICRFRLAIYAGDGDHHEEDCESRKENREG